MRTKLALPPLGKSHLRTRRSHINQNQSLKVNPQRPQTLYLLHLTGLPMKKNMTNSRRSQDSRNLSVAIFNQLHLRLMIGLHQKMTGLQHIAVVDVVPVAIEEVGGVDIAENEDGVPTEIVVGALTVVGGMANSEDAEKVTVLEETVNGEVEAKVTVDEKGMKVTVAVGGDEVKDAAGRLLHHNRVECIIDHPGHNHDAKKHLPRAIQREE